MANKRKPTKFEQLAATDFRRPALLSGGILVAIVFLFQAWSWLPPPPLGTDEEVFKTVDALFTALTSRNSKWLEDCEQRLETFRDEERLPAKSAKYLEGVIAQARAGDWEPAARRLYDFIYRQRSQA